MDWMLNIEMKKMMPAISYRDTILLTGSCFTEHIGHALGELKFSVLQNPNGILFGPDAVCKSLLSYVENKQYTASELFQLNEVWCSWQHHSRFSHTQSGKALQLINKSQQQAHEYLKSADWLIVTLGSAFTYSLTPAAERANAKIGDTVANCHRAPAQWFDKQMLDITSIQSMLSGCLDTLSKFNKKLKVILTISPVRHIRDGVVENNRSKARLIEAVHHITDQYKQAYYFPAYELVVDVLRDYRFYDIDLVHPNYAATEFVMEKFSTHCIDEESQHLMTELKKIVVARKHRPFQPETKAHQQFLVNHFEKAKSLQEKYPFLDLQEELIYFSET